MGKKKLSGKALAEFEAGRDVWQEVLDGVRKIKAGGGKRTKVAPKSQVVRVRLKSSLSQAQFAAALGVSKRTLEQWDLLRACFRIASRSVAVTHNNPMEPTRVASVAA